MAGIWHIRLKEPGGSVVAMLSTWGQLRVAPMVNGPGGYELELVDVADGLCDLFEPDGQLEFWRADPAADIDWRKEFEAFHVDPRRWVDRSRVTHFRSRGVGYADLLNRRITAGYAGSAETDKTGPAETVIKAFVDEQAGPGAGARALAGLSVEADGAGGNTIALARSYRKLLMVCQEIAAIGGGDFAVVGTGAATFEFRWYEGQLGTDRRNEVLFSLPLGNMVEPDYTMNRSEEANALLVAGQGEGDDRVRFWHEDGAAQLISPWNRREEFIDARDLETLAGLKDRAEARLAEKKVQENLTFKVLQAPGTVYARDYFLGDIVRGEFAGHVIDQKITGLVFTVNKDGEQLEVELTDV